MAETTVYLTVEPRWSSYNPEKLAGIGVTNCTKNKPSHPTGPVVKLTLRIPDGAFKPLAPTVTIDIPESALDYPPVVTVELPDPA